VQIRPAQAPDVVAVSEIVERAYGIYIERIGRRPAPIDDDYAEKIHKGAVFVADDGGVAGLLVLLIAPEHLLIENVAVDPERQGRA
jgi:N-acetylglutamate synthase-like GNAT family acetyltransferase